MSAGPSDETRLLVLSREGIAIGRVHPFVLTLSFERANFDLHFCIITFYDKLTIARR